MLWWLDSRKRQMHIAKKWTPLLLRVKSTWTSSLIITGSLVILYPDNSDIWWNPAWASPALQHYGLHKQESLFRLEVWFWCNPLSVPSCWFFVVGKWSFQQFLFRLRLVLCCRKVELPAVPFQTQAGLISRATSRRQPITIAFTSFLTAVKQVERKAPAIGATSGNTTPVQVVYRNKSALTNDRQNSRGPAGLKLSKRTSTSRSLKKMDKYSFSRTICIDGESFFMKGAGIWSSLHRGHPKMNPADQQLRFSSFSAKGSRKGRSSMYSCCKSNCSLWKRRWQHSLLVDFKVPLVSSPQDNPGGRVWCASHTRQGGGSFLKSCSISNNNDTHWRISVRN